ncbi:alpha/beta hydrolase family protein [Candidatus Chloroploca mongolica]|nr:alpha/beta fold hydrolase [Candidatus Chloroploca mongolica]
MFSDRWFASARYLLLLLLSLAMLVACTGQPVGSAPPVATAPPARTATPVATVTPVATAAPAPTATSMATVTPMATATPAPTATPVPTATPDPVAGLTIPALRALRYGAGELVIGERYASGPGYTTYRITYPSVDGLRLTGLLHLPDGTGPFPVLIANRGYIAPERYQPGMDSRVFSDYAAQRGYLVVAPDYRGYGGGDAGPNAFYTGYYLDVLSLIPLVQRLPMAREGKVGMWGHSRGASITVAALTISDQLAAAVVYAPAPADLAVDYARRFQQSGGDPGTETWPFPPERDPDAYARVSPLTYLGATQAPVMLHHGTADTTVASSASIAIAETLRAAGKDVTLHLYEAGPHTLTGAQEQLYLERSLTFFDQHLRVLDTNEN